MKTIGVNDPVIPLQYHPSKLIQFSQQLGVGLDSLLVNTNISPEQINKRKGYISYLQYAQLVNNAIRCTGKADLGLLFGKELNISSHGIIGFASMCRATIKDAINIAAKYKKTVSPITRMRLDIVDETATLYIEHVLGTKDLEAFFIEVLFSSLLSNMRYLSHESSPAVDLFFKHQQPEYLKSYQDNLGGTLHFDQPNNMIQCGKSLLDTKLVLSNSAASNDAEKQCIDKVNELYDRDSLVVIVRDQLVKQVGYFPTLLEVASNLGTSSSTLKRKLKENKTSYQAILDDVRKELALKYLNNGCISIDDIAHKLSFKEGSNFRRAFKKWTGMTAVEYREKHR